MMKRGFPAEILRFGKSQFDTSLLERCQRGEADPESWESRSDFSKFSEVCGCASIYF